MADTIGRVEFIVGLDGSKLSKEAKDAGANISKIGEEHGEKYGKGFDDESSLIIDKGLSKSMQDAERRWIQGGKKAGKSYGQEIEIEVEKSFSRLKKDTMKAIGSQEGFIEFAKGFDHPNDAIDGLILNMERINQIELEVEGMEELDSFFTDLDVETATDDILEWGIALDETNESTKRLNKANDDVINSFDRFQKSIDATSFDKLAADLGGSAEAAEYLHLQMDDLTESGLISEKQINSTTIAIEKQTERFDANTKKAKEKVDSDHELAISMEKVRVETEKYNQAMFELEGIMANQQVWNDYVVSMGDNEKATKKAKEQVRDLSIEFDIGARETQKMTQKIDGLSLGFDKSNKSSEGFFSSLTKGFKKMPRGIRMTIAITGAVLALGSALSAVASGALAALTGIISSIAVAASGALAALGGLAVGFVWTFKKAKDAIGMMEDAWPPAQAAMDRFAAAAEADSMAFAQAWGPALEDFLNTLSQLWEDDLWGHAAGEALAGVTDAFTDVLKSPAFTAFADAMENQIPNSILNVGTAAASLGEALLLTFAGSSDMLVEMTAGFDAWAQNIEDNAQKAFDTGTMQAFFDLAMQSIDALMGAIGSIGQLFKTVFREGADAGNDMLDLFADATNALNDFLNTPAGNDSLNQWFQNGVALFDVLLDLIKDVSIQFAEMITQEAVDDMIAALAGLSDALQFIFDLMQIFGGLDIIGNLVVALQSVSAFLAPFTESLVVLAEVVGDVLNVAFQALVPIFAAVGETLAPIVNAFVLMAATVLDAVIPVLQALMPPIQAVVEAFIPLGQLVGEILVWAFNTLWPVIQVVIDFIVNLIDAIAPLIDAVLPLLQTLVDKARDSFERWKPIIEFVADVVTSILIPALDRVIAVIEKVISIITRVIAKFEEMGDWLGEKMPRLFGQFSDSAEESFDATDKSSSRMADGVSSAMGRIGDAVSGAIGWFDGLRTSAREAEEAANSAASAGGNAFIPTPGGPTATPFSVPINAFLPVVVPMGSDPSVNPFAAPGGTPSIQRGGNTTSSTSSSVTGGTTKIVNIEAGAVVVQSAVAPEATALMVIDRMAERIAS